MTSATTANTDGDEGPRGGRRARTDAVDPCGFADLGLSDELQKALVGLGYEEPTPIQREAIPHLIAGSDLLGQAATGTGKTAAFALPILERIGVDAPAVPTALVVVPTRELAVQVSEAIFRYGRDQNIRVLPVFGGQPIYRQIKALERGVHVVVATPGRAIDLVNRRTLKLEKVTTVVLDEADEMLDMGFADDIEAILDATPRDRQTVLFSATMPSRITAIAARYQREPVRIDIGGSSPDAGRALVRQTVYYVRRADKPSALARILDIESPGAALVFCRTRTEVDELTVTLNGRGYRAEALHGGMDQKQRDRVMGRLRDGTAELLVATDVAARGLDVDVLTHVVNYDVPSAAESYVHRIGRVGRAGRSGVAITLAEPRERRLLGNIERLTTQTIAVHKVPSVADLRSRQVEKTVSAIRVGLAADDLDRYRDVVDALSAEDEHQVLLAAIKLVHESTGTTVDEREIPDASDQVRSGRQKGRQDRPAKSRSNAPPRGGPKKGPRKGSGQETGFIHLNVGRRGGVRPSDLVGAIANECGLAGRDVGPIRISDGYSVVGVPEASVDDVLRAMKTTTVRGKKGAGRGATWSRTGRRRTSWPRHRECRSPRV